MAPPPRSGPVRDRRSERLETTRRGSRWTDARGVMARLAGQDPGATAEPARVRSRRAPVSADDGGGARREGGGCGAVGGGGEGTPTRPRPELPHPHATNAGANLSSSFCSAREETEPEWWVDRLPSRLGEGRKARRGVPCSARESEGFAFFFLAMATGARRVSLLSLHGLWFACYDRGRGVPVHASVRPTLTCDE